VDRATKAGLLDLLDEALDAGWSLRRACAALEVPGVYLLAAAREEDFGAEDALRRALIVRPALNRDTASADVTVSASRSTVKRASTRLGTSGIVPRHGTAPSPTSTW
jgi:hypothetical protein